MIVATVEAERFEEGGRRSAAGDGEARAGAQPAHPRAEAHPQRRSKSFQQSPRPQRAIPTAHVARQRWLQRSAQSL